MTSPLRHTVAAYVPVKNCPDLLAECLSRLDWVDEILIADASTDDRVARMLAERYPRAKHVVDETSDPRIRFNNQVHGIESEFVLGIDADEFYTPESAAEILTALQRPCAHAGFRIPSISYLFGERLGPGATLIKLFRKDRYSWAMRSIHESPEVGGSVVSLTQPYVHYNSPVFSVNPIKVFRYELVQAGALNDDEISRLALDNKGAMSMWRSVLVEWLRLNVRFIRTAWGCRKLGFVGVFLAYAQVLQVIARHVCPTDERRMRSGIVTRDGNGYL